MKNTSGVLSTHALTYPEQNRTECTVRLKCHSTFIMIKLINEEINTTFFLFCILRCLVKFMDSSMAVVPFVLGMLTWTHECTFDAIYNNTKGTIGLIYRLW